MIEAEEPVLPTLGGLIDQLCGADPLHETYRCSFGLNPDHADIFEGTDFNVAAQDPDGAVRAMALEGHQFFWARLFSPNARR